MIPPHIAHLYHRPRFGSTTAYMYRTSSGHARRQLVVVFQWRPLASARLCLGHSRHRGTAMEGMPNAEAGGAEKWKVPHKVLVVA